MFTGIVKAQGTVKKINAKNSGLILQIQCPLFILRRLKGGSSIAVNGVCATIVKKEKNHFEIFLMPETLKITTLGLLKTGDKVNLEPSLRVGDELGGHFVLGHVDGVCEIQKVHKVESDVVIELKAPRKLMRYIFHKGSVALNGVSLTIVDVNKKNNWFRVALIPYTIRNTIFGQKKAGDKINIEVDAMVRCLID